MKTLVIGQDIEIYAYTTKQAGYGRQHLYIHFFYEGKRYDGVYVMDIYPNVHEHFSNQAILNQDAFPMEGSDDLFTDGNQNGEYTIEQIFNTTDDLLNYVLKGNEVEIEEDDEEE